MRIAIASGKGGTGKTTIATNLSQALALGGESVSYVDCDVEEPNGHLFLTPEEEERVDVSVCVPIIDESSCTLCGVCSDVCRFNAIAVLESRVLVFPAMCHSCGACVELCPEHAISESSRSIGFIRRGKVGHLHCLGGNLNVGEAISPPVIARVKKEAPETEVIIFDSPPGTSCPVIEAVRNVDFVILVTEPTPFGYHDLKLAVEMVRCLQLPFGVFINRADTGNGAVKQYCVDEQVPVVYELPFDRRLAETYATGHLLVDTNPELRHDLTELYAKIEGLVNDDRTGSLKR